MDILTFGGLLLIDENYFVGKWEVRTEDRMILLMNKCFVSLFPPLPSQLQID
jgi:hypothetical protein